MVVASGKQHPNIVRDGEKAMNDVIIIGLDKRVYQPLSLALDLD